MKLALVFTNDWELFGDGSGDYFDIQHKPLERLLNTFDDHGAKLTVMAEVGQQWAHLELAPEQPRAVEIAAAWEIILKKVVEVGFDVQLHLHPQWLNAVHDSDGWRLDYSRWAVSSLPRAELDDVLRRGKQYLEDVLTPVNAGYRCVAFRAGAYCIEPSGEVIESLQDSGFLYDTSISKGFYEPGFYDYRDAESNVRPWYASDADVKYGSDRAEGLLELPVFSYRAIDVPAWRRLRSRIYTREMSRRYPPERRPIPSHRPLPVQAASRTTLGRLRGQLSKLVRVRQVRLDYDALAPGEFVKAVRNLLQSDDLSRLVNEDITLPVIATGHVKNMLSDDNVARILDGLSTAFGSRVVFMTLTEAAATWARQSGECSPKQAQSA